MNLDFGINVPPEWFFSNGNYNFDLDLASVDWSKVNDNTRFDLGQNLIQEYDIANPLTPEGLHDTDGLDTWSCPSIPSVSKSGTAYSSDQVISSGIQSQNDSPPNRKTFIHPHKYESRILTSFTAILQWNETMSATAHSDFFGLDLDLCNNLSPYTISPEVWAQAQENLSRWVDLDHEQTPDLPELSPPDSATHFRHDEHSPAKVDSLTKSPSTYSTSSSYPDVVKQSSRDVVYINNKPHNSSLSTSKDILTYPSTSKVTKSKQFHFVANSDKKTATRLRNTMTSRNLRQSKVSRIAQLEKELEDQLRTTQKWKARAMELGWRGEDEEADKQ